MFIKCVTRVFKLLSPQSSFLVIFPFRLQILARSSCTITLCVVRITSHHAKAVIESKTVVANTKYTLQRKRFREAAAQSLIVKHNTIVYT